MGGGLLLSLVLHGLIVAVLLFDLPRPMAEPEPPEEVVAVTIVPPPEPAPEPEEPAPAAEAPPEAPAEPEPAEAAEAESPPPALPEGEAVPIPVLRPVFAFGEEDRGPEIALDGGAAQAPAEEPAETPLADPQTATGPEAETEPEAVAQPEPAPEAETEPAPEPETAAEVPPEAETAADVPPEPETPVADSAETLAETLAETPAETAAEQPAQAAPAEIAVPDAEQAGDQPGDLPEAAEQTETAALPEKPADPAPSPPKPDSARAKPSRSPDAEAVAPADTAPAGDNGLPGVRRLSSSVNTGHAVATTAMGALPRDARGSQLCTTELREQLRRAPESYRVELLPAYRLPGGTVLNVPNAAFRAGGDWYNLSFRCTVDADALRVTGFSFKVGAPIPRTQWRQRGFPDL